MHRPCLSHPARYAYDRGLIGSGAALALYCLVALWVSVCALRVPAWLLRCRRRSTPTVLMPSHTHTHTHTPAQVVWIAASRLYLGLHTPVDILAGAVAGLAVLVCFIAVEGGEAHPAGGGRAGTACMPRSQL